MRKRIDHGAIEFLLILALFAGALGLAVADAEASTRSQLPCSALPDTGKIHGTLVSQGANAETGFIGFRRYGNSCLAVSYNVGVAYRYGAQDRTLPSGQAKNRYIARAWRRGQLER